MTDSGGSDECALGHNAGSLLSRDTGDRGALSALAKLNQKLNYAPTEARRVCANMMTSVVVSIGGMQGLGKFGILRRSSVRKILSRDLLVPGGLL